ncbi:magnesium transporter [Entomortierella parvispora]|uniref:Magnesium transporter n=1 Tax=Entomortierella parvispora TaxID=205924 RepID=A0A9P3LSK1_9FUNG|nr:magnesium transporter [Entomortierella parvispora]
MVGGTTSPARRFFSIQPTKPWQQKNGNGNGNGHGHGHEHRYDTSILTDDPTQALQKSLASVPQYASKNEIKLRVTELDMYGNIKMTAGEFLKTDLCQQFGLHPRDLRKIDGGFSQQIPVVLVRPEVILVNLGNIRALIKSDLVLLFDLPDEKSPYEPSLFVKDLQEKLKSNPGTFLGQPFEFRVLESIFISVVASLHAEMEVLAHLVMGLLGHLENKVDQKELKELLLYTKKVGRFESKTLLIRDVFEELLEADEDLAAMYLTEKKRGHPRPTDSHDEMEILLEAYVKQVEEIANVVALVKHQIQSTEDYVNVMLDAKRNQILLFELRIAMGTLGISSGAIIAGLYGMNMPNYLEEDPHAFAMVTASVAMICATVFSTCARKLRILAKGTT